MPEFITVDEFASRAGVHPHTIRRRIKAGGLKVKETKVGLRLASGQLKTFRKLREGRPKN